MSTPFWRSPHEGATPQGTHAPNAALLIDFDNVTMGMRSDLAKELKTLLDSDIIKGKVTVQRAYADWRRYPQYIVPLSEASIDLIFAPAYGSSKKNATDIRMAIDGMEIVFIRPEIGTFILLTGDSDFSSLVLKLKEYGKYVIGIGIQESSSDILVQNCDEYYSYTSISGLRKTTDLDQVALDPWMAVEQALERMIGRNDVMRSDRLKQVILEIDPGFDEKSYGYSKFSKFLAEASSKGLVSLKKLDNGQYEVSPSKDGRSDRSRRSEGRRGKKENRRGRRTEAETAADAASEASPSASSSDGAGEGDPLQAAYGLLRKALAGFGDDAREGVRDSDVKRKMLAIDRGFDEAELGFGKFSRFLKQAHEHGVIVLARRESGNYEVRTPDGADRRSEPEAPKRESGEADGRSAAREETRTAGTPPTTSDERSAAADGARRAVGAGRGSSHGRSRTDEKPPLLEGQIVPPPGASATSKGGGGGGGGSGALAGMDLPSEPEEVVRYLTERYKGVGRKTAESLVEAFGGAGVFRVFHEQPDRLSKVVTPRRAEQVLEAWQDDYAFRVANAGPEGAVASRPSKGGGGRRTRRGARRGSSRRRSS